MGILKFLFHFFIFHIIYASKDCHFSLCGNNSILIRFPFQPEGEKNPYCGYPGFNLICTNDSKTVLKLPHSGEFYVGNINYLTQQLQVYDPHDCLPKRLLSLNLSGSPFTPTLSRNYTFLSCSSQNKRPQFIPIECLSNSTNFVYVIPSVNMSNNYSLPDSCNVIKRLSAPIARPGWYKENLRDDLSEDLLLTWDKPDCRYCESQELMCGFESSNSNRVICFSDSQTDNAQRGLQLYRIITLCITIPASIFIILIGCCVCYRDRIGNTPPNPSNNIAAISLEPAIATTGLDESTIESYEKVVLGESRRVPGPNDGCCWICLSEYNSKETIKLIPECKHCFHADCIDEWLRMNNTCPVCRNSPYPLPAITSSTSNP